MRAVPGGGTAAVAASPERVLLVTVDIGGRSGGEYEAAEMRSLVRSAGGEVVAEASQSRGRPDPATFVGKGKAEELASTASDGGITTIAVDHDLSPGQASRLEDVTGCKVIDRTELILAIFARRARTTEARLQIELAQLEYSLPRLSGMWHHFSRLGAGIGTRGPGETQLEVDRRRVRSRIGRLQARLERIERRWDVTSAGRGDMFCVSLVGYTNAGKSTLINRLCGAEVPVDDRPFETLDTTSRRLGLPDGSVVLLSDTVGFIERLPETLVASFSTTLAVAREADLLLVVVDRSSPQRERQLATVRRTLDRIGVPREVPRVMVWTKMDLVPRESPGSGVAVSSRTGAGLDDLLGSIAASRDASLEWFELELAPDHGGRLNWLYENCVVRESTDLPDGGVRLLAGAPRGYDSVAGRMRSSKALRRLRRLSGPACSVEGTHGP